MSRIFAVALLLACAAFSFNTVAADNSFTHLSTDEVSRLAYLGIAPAQTELGIRYCNGQGVQQNYQQGATWLGQAAAQGDAEAQFRLGRLYEDGLGVAQDAKLADVWIRKAAAQGHAAAVSYLKQAKASQTPSQQPAPQAGTNCKPKGYNPRCTASCNNGECVMNYENGCEVRVKVKPKFNPLSNQWECAVPKC